MRRLLAIFLLILLPLQSAWAMVGAYCQNETGAAAQHFGHHDHRCQHHQHDGGDSDKASGGIDHHGGGCHGTTAAVLPADFEFPTPMPATTIAVEYRLSPSAPPHYPPERPNWALLA